MNNPVITNMLFRANHCRRLASSITDERTVQALLGMAQEIEADARRLEQDDDGSDDLARLDPTSHDHVAPKRNIHIQVACTACGSNHFLCHGDDEEDSEVFCAQCGHVAGTMGSVKQAIATVIVERETIARRPGSQTHDFDDQPKLRMLDPKQGSAG